MSEFRFRSISLEQKDNQILYMHWYWPDLGDFLQLWVFIDVDWDFYAHLAFLQHEKGNSRAIVRSSDNSSLNFLSAAILILVGGFPSNFTGETEWLCIIPWLLHWLFMELWPLMYWIFCIKVCLCLLSTKCYRSGLCLTLISMLSNCSALLISCAELLPLIDMLSIFWILFICHWALNIYQDLKSLCV